MCGESLKIGISNYLKQDKGRGGQVAMTPNRCLFVEVLTIKRAEVNFNFLLHELLKVNRKPFLSWLHD